MDAEIKDLFATILQISNGDFDDSSRRDNIAKWDSFQHLILVAAFEEEFNISIEPEEIVEMYKDFLTFKTIVLGKL